MYRCRFCGFESDSLSDFEPDTSNNAGYWCPYCDGFTYFSMEERSFLLILENKGMTEQHEKAPFPVHCSPLRYPGGKSHLAGKIFNICRKENIRNFIEPFAGGASIGLSFLLSGNVEELYLNDADYGIYALFKTITECPERLKERIRAFVPTKEAFYECRKHVLDGYKECSQEDAAWYLLVTNRLAFSGIAFANCKGKPLDRWNAETLCRRIDRISIHEEHIHLSNMDAIKFIEEMYWMPDATLFIDPPYYGKGKALYPLSYSLDEHKELAFLLNDLYKQCPGADMIITYDFEKEICEMYDWPKQTVIGRNYSIRNNKIY